MVPNLIPKYDWFSSMFCFLFRKYQSIFYKAILVAKKVFRCSLVNEKSQELLLALLKVLLEFCSQGRENIGKKAFNCIKRRLVFYRGFKLVVSKQAERWGWERFNVAICPVSLKIYDVKRYQHHLLVNTENSWFGAPIETTTAF